MSLDLWLCESVLRDGSLDRVRKAGVTADMLFDGGHRVFEYIQDHLAEYGCIPTREVILAETGDDIAGLEGSPPAADYLIAKVLGRHRENVIREGIHRAATALKKGFDPALREFNDLHRRLASVSRTVDLRATGPEIARVMHESYERVKHAEGGIDGIPFPWPALNRATLGAHGGELVVIVARTKIGKTWCQLVIGDHAWRTGHKVLIISMEMTRLAMLRRLFSIHKKIPVRDIREGRLGEMAEREFFAWVERAEAEMPDIWCAGPGEGISTVRDMDLLIADLRPDIVLLDGLYILRAANRGQSWERIKEVVSDVHDMALRADVPVIATTQFNADVGEGATSASTDSIAFGRSIGMYCDLCIACFADNELREHNRMLMRTIAARECEPLSWLVEWDLTAMSFKEIGVMGGAVASSHTFSAEDTEKTIEF